MPFPQLIVVRQRPASEVRFLRAAGTSESFSLSPDGVFEVHGSAKELLVYRGGSLMQNIVLGTSRASGAGGEQLVVPDPAHLAKTLARTPKNAKFTRSRAKFGPHVVGNDGRCFVVALSSLETQGGEAVSIGAVQAVEEYLRLARSGERSGMPSFANFAETVAGLRTLPNFCFLSEEDATAAYAALLTRG